MGPIIMLFVFAVALIAGPIAASVSGHPLGALTTAVLTGSGILLAVVSGTLMVITRLYKKTKASEAFVRTGMGGMRVIKDGGSIVIPVIHQTVGISLRTMRLDVSREAADALITMDKLRADIKAEFFVRVMPKDEDIQAAARSFGEHMDDDRYVARIIEDKLISALRTVAATKTLEGLNTQRDEFVKQVTEIVTPDLNHNGLTLEVVTISKLDQTDPKNLRDDNIFDAQGKRTIAEITQAQLTARNALERKGERERTQQDVETRQQVLQLEQTKAQAESEQAAAIAKIKAEQEQQAKTKQVAAEQAVQLATVEKEKAIQVATREQQQAIEVAERAKQAAIAEAEAQRAAKQASLAQAEAEREKQQQAVKTVTVTAEAERAKTTAVIAATASAEQQYVTAAKQADAQAYSVQKEAEGKKAAADAEAVAIQKRAEAEAAAAKARAQGAQAEQMVPVEVKKAEVQVESQRVDVLQRELEARSAHGAAAQQFEIDKLRITKEAEIRVAGAHAMATFGGKIEATVVGTPEDVSRMTQAYMRGMGVARTIDGFLAAASDDARETVEGVGAQLASLVQSAARRLGSKPEDLVAAATSAVAKQTTDPAKPATGNGAATK